MHTETSETKILSIPVPRALEDFIKERVSSQGFHTVSEYVRALIRADQEQAARQRLEAKLLEAVERGDYREVTPAFWKRLEAIARDKPTPPRKRKREQP
jgi:putative addiction module CopG family antidote